MPKDALEGARGDFVDWRCCCTGGGGHDVQDYSGDAIEVDGRVERSPSFSPNLLRGLRPLAIGSLPPLGPSPLQEQQDRQRLSPLRPRARPPGLAPSETGSPARGDAGGAMSSASQAGAFPDSGSGAGGGGGGPPGKGLAACGLAQVACAGTWAEACAAEDDLDPHNVTLADWSPHSEAVPLGGREPAMGCNPGLCSPPHTAGLSDEAAKESEALRLLMKRFVTEMVKGRQYAVLVESGNAEPCLVVLTPSLLALRLEMQGTVYEVPLKMISDAFSGVLPSNRFAPIFLDDFCSTLVLKNHECVSFRFQTLQERNDFTRCIKVLSLALEG